MNIDSTGRKEFPVTTNMSNASDLKFLHIANHRHENLFQAPIMIGGFYNWHLAMNGEFNLYKMKEDSLENYDILFIGMSKPELEGYVASRIREKIGWETKTKLVICIDYSIELWQGVFNPYSLEHELMQGDLIFVSEPMMQSYVNSVLDGRKKVHHIVHPTNIDSVSQFYKPKEIRQEELAVLVHRYDNNWLAPFLATKDLPWDAHAVFLDPNMIIHLYAYYKYMRGGFEFTQYLDWVSRKMVLVDSYHKIHTYGRTAVDNACLQLPTVGSNWTYSQKYLWPDLTVEAGDVYKQKQLVRKLMENEEFYDTCVEQALEKLETYSYENRKQELLNKLYN